MKNLKKSIDESLSVLGIFFLVLIILSFFIKDSSYFYNGRIYLIVYFLGDTVVGFFRLRKSEN